MTYVTGQPIVFVGTGQVRAPPYFLFFLGYIRHLNGLQTYTDLKQLRVTNVVQAILSD
jgi:hypothetical protein